MTFVAGILWSFNSGDVSLHNDQMNRGIRELIDSRMHTDPKRITKSKLKQTEK